MLSFHYSVDTNTPLPPSKRANRLPDAEVGILTGCVGEN